MITQDLLTYIKQQLDLGRTKDQIKLALLNSGGWNPTDIGEAFGLIARSTMSTSPVSASGAITTPSQQPTGVVATTKTSNTVPVVNQEAIYAIKESSNNYIYGIIGFAAMLLSLGAAYFLIPNLLSSVYFNKIIIGVSLVILVPTVILWLVTVITNTPNRSFAKAFFMNEIFILLAIFLNYIFGKVSIGLVPKISQNIAFGLLILAWLFTFVCIYKCRWLKAIWAGIINAVITIIISSVLALVLLGNTFFYLLKVIFKL